MSIARPNPPPRPTSTRAVPGPPPRATDHQLRQAERGGAVARDIGLKESHCPYPRVDDPRRAAWMRGFLERTPQGAPRSAGRVRSVAFLAPSPVVLAMALRAESVGRGALSAQPKAEEIEHLAAEALREALDQTFRSTR